ncbi:uncharacterized protein LOC111702216, partial [Eurytemora carolleeae]|uniref:uncharacterized protein LOC111702216 n=1 Tax=Eurytemora carolleeae TaxID=1294199 RepID=UPI000C76D461
MYVDKYRQAAVLTGERDVKTDVRIKKKRDRLQGQAAAADEHDYETYLAQGIFEMRSGTAEKALHYFNKAIDMESEDEVPYIVRSECLRRLEKSDEAKLDAEIALKINKSSTKAVVALGEAMFQLGQFEFALVQFERGLKIRMETTLKKGAEKCKDAILHSLGTRIPKYDLNVVRLVVKERARQEKMENKAKDKNPLTEEKTMRKRIKKAEKEKEKVDKLLLGKLDTDRVFLKKFVGFENNLQIR